MDNPVKQLRILMLEDTPSDAEMEEIELREAGLAYTLLRVDNRAAFEQALDDFKPDIVLADYRLPNYNGRDALEYTRRTHPHIPVIMVTGAMGDVAAIELLKLGARDYVLKDGLVRLVPAINRALSEEHGIRNRKLAERMRQESELRYRRLFESSRDALMTSEPPSWKFTSANTATLQLFGVTSEAEFTSLGPRDVSPPLQPDGRPSGEKVQEMIAIVMRDGSHFFEWTHQRVDGTPFAADVLLTRVEAEGKISVQATVRDITERKNAEDALRRANRALKTLSAGNLALVRATSEDELLRAVTDVIVGTGGYRMAWVGYAEDDAARTVRPVAQSGFEEGYLDSANITWADTERGQGPTGTAIREGATVINQNFLTNPKMAPWRQDALMRGYQSSMAIPLSRINRVLGALTIYSADPLAFNEEEIRLLEELASDLAFGIEAVRTRVAHEQHATILRQSLEQSIQTIAGILEARDPYTAGHQRRVAELATAIARELALPIDQVNGIHLAAIIHDLGKINIPAEILSKPGKLSEIEYALIKTHAQSGYDILKDVKFPWPIADIILQHHEKMDGSGYPQGLKGGQILLESRIMAVADVVEAMSSHRPYRSALGMDNALREIERGRGSLYDPTIVDVCLNLFAKKGFAFSDRQALTQLK